jgi:hypothetical protein
MMKDKMLKILIYVSGLMSLYAFLAVRILPVFNSVLIEKKDPEYFEFTRYGEQYYNSRIIHFRETLPKALDKYRLSSRNPDVNNSDMIAFGDSFFDFSRQKTVAERLHDSLHIRVHAKAGFLDAKDWYPLVYLGDKNYHKSQRKYLIYEVAERNIHDRFIKPHEFKWKITNNNPGTATTVFRKIRDFVFNTKSEELFSLLLQGSYLTSGFYSIIATLKFDLFGYISSRTPVYSLDKFEVPMLFYDITVNDKPTSFYFNHNDSLINIYCKNITDLSEKLMDRYNLKLIFLPVPNKFTIYHSTIRPEDKYDDFLPRLCTALGKHHISCVNLYDDFITSDSLVYYGTDSHWNEKGVSITVNRLLELIRKDTINSTFIKSD